MVMNSPAYIKISQDFYLTAYFTSPDDICDPDAARRRQLGVVSDKLVFLIGRENYMDIPFYEKDLAKQPNWMLGGCFKGMGEPFVCLSTDFFIRMKSIKFYSRFRRMSHIVKQRSQIIFPSQGYRHLQSQEYTI